MDENNSQQMHDNKSNGAYCNCMYCRGGHKHMLIRLILGLIILGMVFCVGVKIGEFKGQYGGYDRNDFYGQRGMMTYPAYQGSQNGYYMMGTKVNQAVPPQAAGGATQAQPAQPVK